MRLIGSIEEMRGFLRHLRDQRQSIGLVPTMGALHEGHLSLVCRARSHSEAVIVSIFVNPLQFRPGEDFGRYPRDLEKDLHLLRSFDIAAVFVPSTAAMYPDGFESAVEPGPLAAVFEGASRPGHFRGVATLVLKLFNIVRPDLACFGQKDLQQALIVRQLVKDFNLDLNVSIAPTVREPDGLAMSSRNAYLGVEARQAAAVLHRAVERAREVTDSGEHETAIILDGMRKILAAETRVKVDYAAIVEPLHLRAVEHVTPGCLALIAAEVGSTRLIDNLIFAPPGASADERIELALSRIEARA